LRKIDGGEQASWANLYDASIDRSRLASSVLAAGIAGAAGGSGGCGLLRGWWPIFLSLSLSHFGVFTFLLLLQITLIILSSLE